MLYAPLRKQKPTRIFVESMSDAFGEWWPLEFVDKLYAVMSATPQHTYINLSKRPERTSPVPRQSAHVRCVSHTRCVCA
jgi:protein gp37